MLSFFNCYLNRYEIWVKIPIFCCITLDTSHCLIRLKHPFAFRTALFLHGIDLTRYQKHPLEHFGPLDLLTLCSCCRLVGCTSMMGIFLSTTPQRCIYWVEIRDAPIPEPIRGYNLMYMYRYRLKSKFRKSAINSQKKIQFSLEVLFFWLFYI